MQKAVLDRIFIKPDEKKQGAIIIDVQEKTKTGVVLSIGKNVKSVNVGDHVIFYDWAELPALDGVLVVRENYLLGIIEDE